LIGRIRELMRAPLARPPGRRGWLRRLAPEICALAVYGTLLALLIWWEAVWPRIWAQGETLGRAVLMAYGLAGVLMILAAIGTGVLALARERARGTLDALLLTTADRRKLVLGRFWCLVAPWLRLFLYLLPLYVIMSCSDLFRDAHRDPEKEIVSLFCVFSHNFNLLFIALRYNYYSTGGGPHPWSIFLALLRWLNDFSIFLFAAAAAFHSSARVRSTGRALLLAYLLVPLALGTVLGLHAWWVAAIKIWGLLPTPREWIATAIYALLAVSSLAFRIRLTWLLLGRTARNFDWYALGERPPGGRAGSAALR